MRSNNKARAHSRVAVAPFIKFALPLHREVILEAVRKLDFNATAYLELDLEGVPAVRQISLFARPQPAGRVERIEVDIVRVDDMVLTVPIQAVFTLHESERPVVRSELPMIEIHGVALKPPGEPVVPAAGVEPRTRRTRSTSSDEQRARTITLKRPTGLVVWHLVDTGEAGQEVRKLERDGTAVFSAVDTKTYCYRMACPRCGRVRYSKPNSVHQIDLCWVCTRSDRLQRRALSQYRSRRRKT